MPLVVMCGIPGSGKTTRALALKAALEDRHKCRVVLVNEESLGLKKEAAYMEKDQEKITRGQLKFETEKNLNNETVVILDSMNYIKGYRYQMYCSARQMKSTYCVIFCNTSHEAARKFNSLNENRYSEPLWEDLAKRLEVPQLKNRWDVPLFERRETEQTPLDEIIDVLLFQEKKSKDPISTKSEEKIVGENYLLELDSLVTAICEDITRQQQERGVGFPMVFNRVTDKLVLQEQWSVIALKKTKNQFLTVIKGKPIPLEQAGSSFCAFIREADKRR